MKTHFANLLAFSLCCSILPRVVWVAHSYIHPPKELGNNEGLFNLFPSPQQCSSFTFLDISQPFLTSSSHGQMITNMWMDEEERAQPMVDCWKRADLGHISSDENVTLILEKKKNFCHWLTVPYYVLWHHLRTSVLRSCDKLQNCPYDIVALQKMQLSQTISILRRRSKCILLPSCYFGKSSVPKSM